MLRVGRWGRRQTPVLLRRQVAHSAGPGGGGFVTDVRRSRWLVLTVLIGLRVVGGMFYVGPRRHTTPDRVPRSKRDRLWLHWFVLRASIRS